MASTKKTTRKAPPRKEPYKGKTCEECSYFVMPFKGKTCRQDGKDPDEVACTAFTPRKSDEKPLDELAAADPFVQRIRRIVKKPVYDLGAKNLVHELKGYTVFWQQTRTKITRPVPHTATPHTLSNLSLYFEQTQAYQDRTTSIKIDLLKIKRRIDALWLSAEAWLQKWPAAANLKTERQRLAYLSETFKPLKRKVDEVAMLVKMCDMVIDNLTHAHFSLKEIREAVSEYLGKTQQI